MAAIKHVLYIEYVLFTCIVTNVTINLCIGKIPIVMTHGILCSNLLLMKCLNPSFALEVFILWIFTSISLSS